MSSVVLETQSTSTTGPVISVSCLSGPVSKETPSCGSAPASTVEVHEAEATPALVIPLAEYSTDAAFFGASSTSASFSR